MRSTLYERQLDFSQLIRMTPAEIEARLRGSPVSLGFNWRGLVEIASMEALPIDMHDATALAWARGTLLAYNRLATASDSEPIDRVGQLRGIPQRGDEEWEHEQVKAADTELTWAASDEPDLDHYEVVWRPTPADQWTHVIDVGAGTSATINLSKDNAMFGVRAVDTAGHRSPAAFPGL